MMVNEICSDARLRAWNADVRTSSQRLVLLCIAKYTDTREIKASPSLREIADETRLNKKTVESAIKQLKERGILEVTRSNRHNRNAYEIKELSASISDENEYCSIDSILKAYRFSLKANYLTANDIALLALFAFIANKKTKRFQISTLRVMKITKLDVQSFRESRDNLKLRGLIDFYREKGSPTLQYELRF